MGDRDRYPHFNDFYIPLIFSWAEDNKAKEDAISLFEKKHQIILPIEYKDFLMYVTNGNKITEQGTICKMLPLGSNISYLINENFLKRYINGFGRVGVLKEYLNGMKDLGDFDFLLNKASSEINPSLPFSYERDEGLIEAVGRAEYYPAFILEEEWRSANIPKIKKQLNRP